VGRAAALLALLAALVGWYEAAPHLGPLSTWHAIVLISVAIMPACLLLVWLALPLRRQRLLLPAGIACVGLAALLALARFPVGSNFAKLAALTLLGWWFLCFFEAVSWVVLVALLIPWVDAYSVWRGPTKTLTSKAHEHVFEALSVAFVVPGGGAARLGLPDVLFFAVFLGASARFRLRPGWTFAAMLAGLALTMVLATAWDVGGLPALPAISLGFLVPNADLLRRRLRAARAGGGLLDEEGDRLDVRGVREHVDGDRPDE